MRPEEERSGPAQGRPPTPSTTGIVAQTADIERARRRWRLHQIGHRRRISAALDRHCGIERPAPCEVDYAAMGFTLGWTERRAAGLRLLERERAA